jgi:2'-5' RNA ligase
MTDRFHVSVLRFDPVAEQQIRGASLAIRRALRAKEEEASPPHVSLIPSDTLEERELIDRVRGVIANQAPLDVTVAHLGWFSSGVLFLGVTPTTELLDLHRRVHAASAPSSKAKYIDLYKPGAWVPHCTLATGVSDDAAARAMRAAIEQLRLPHTARCTSLELVEIAGTAKRTVATFRLPAGG